jgi:hypothetical protein
MKFPLKFITSPFNFPANLLGLARKFTTGRPCLSELDSPDQAVLELAFDRQSGSTGLASKVLWGTIVRL